MRTRAVALLAALASAATLGASGAAPAASTRTVTLRDIAFSPQRLTIAAGTRVAFAFRDGTTVHNVTSTGAKRFTTIGNRSSGSRSRTFNRAGSYRYACTLHPGMTGRIVVH